jgi:hypothetical protein
MAGRFRDREWSEEQLEDLVRGLPQRTPDADLRARVLAAAAARQTRPAGRRRPALAVAALALLVLADMLVLRQQTPPPSASPEPQAIAAARPLPREEAALLREFGPVDVAVVRGYGDASEEIISSANGTMLYRFTETLGPGSYRLLINNHGGSEVGIEYQVHQDFLVVANMTAKNVMAISLALAMGIVALLLYGRPRRT